MVCVYSDEASAVAKLARCMVERALSHAGRPERRHNKESILKSKVKDRKSVV